MKGMCSMKSEVILLREGRTDVTLTTYVLDHSPELPGGESRPAVLICPGGAYLNCSDREGEPIAMAFAAMGYHTFVLRYSVYTEGVPCFPDLSQPLEPKEHCIHPNPVWDMAAAMLYIRDHARQWHLDADRIAVCGFSAGAHNSAMYATNWHRDYIADHFGRPAEDFRPAACILGYTLSDYIYMKESNRVDPLFIPSKIALLGEAFPSDEVLHAVSPARNVTEHTPPTFLWATCEDSLVPVQHTLIMAKALADGNIPFEVHVFEGGPHGLATATQASALAKTNLLPDAAKWVPMCDAWLMRRFAFDLPDLSPWEMMELEQKNK